MKNRDAMDIDDDTALVNASEVPSIEEIQQTLVSINDKPSDFFGSTEWLGSLEVRKFENSIDHTN